MTKEKTEKHEFQAEVRRLMDIVINSLYTRQGDIHQGTGFKRLRRA